MNCPECGSPYLRVRVVFSGSVACAFSGDQEHEFDLIETVSLDSRWNDSSACQCLTCSWTGIIGDARAARGEPQRRAARPTPATAMTIEELRTIQKELESTECEPHWRNRLERLLGEVKRLTWLLDTAAAPDSASPDQTHEHHCPQDGFRRIRRRPVAAPEQGTAARASSR